MEWTETGGSKQSYAFRTSAVRLFILPFPIHPKGTEG